MYDRVLEIGSEYDWDSNDAFLLPENGKQTLFSAATKYRSGRDALKAVASACQGRYKQVLINALCCESMVSPFTLYGMKPVFYRMNPEYSADFDDVIQKMTNESVLLFAPYFGIHPFTPCQLERLREAYPNAVFLEDRTQDILCASDGGFQPDITIASIRKWIAIPDGGLLWSDHIVVPQGTKNDAFAELRTNAMKRKSRYLENGDPELKSVFRNLLGEAAELLDGSKEIVSIYETSAQIIDKIDFDRIFEIRKKNTQVLEAALASVLQSGKLRILSRKNECSTLYFPVLTDRQGALQARLAQEGIYCPVIWPVPKEAVGVCPIAEYTASHMLAIPCDHRYTPDDMAHIGAVMVRILHEQ